MKSWIIGIGCVVGVAGCAPKVWVKPGATDQDFASDSYICEKDARQSGYFGTGVVGAVNMDSFMSRCMVAHGYRQQTSAPTPTFVYEDDTTSNPKDAADRAMSAARGDCFQFFRNQPNTTMMERYDDSFDTCLTKRAMELQDRM